MINPAQVDAEDLKDGGADEATENASGHNAGKGNRAVAAHIKNLHAASAMSGSVSSTVAPNKTLVFAQHSASAQGVQGKPAARPLD